MKVQQSELKRSLSFAREAADPRSPLPIHAYVRLQCREDGDLLVEATDSTIAAGVLVRCEDVGRTFDLCTSAAQIAKIVDSVAGVIELERTGEELTLRAGKSRFTIETALAADFPRVEWPKGKLDKVAPTFTAAAKAVAHSICEDESRPHLSGYLLLGDTLAATDGHRAITVADGVIEGAKARRVLPTQLVKLAGKLEGPIGCTVIGERAFFVAEDRRSFVSHALAGQEPPQIERVTSKIPGASTWTCRRDELASSVARVRTCAADKDGAVSIVVNEGALRLEAKAPGKGTASDEIEVDGNGNSIVSVNARYLAEAVAVCDADQVVIEIGGELDQIAIVGTSTREVIMPVRV